MSPVVISPLALTFALVQQANEILRSGQSLPAFWKEVLRHNGLVRKLVDSDAPLVEGPCDLHLEVLLGGLIAHDPVVVEASLSRHCHSCKSCGRGGHGRWLIRASSDYNGPLANPRGECTRNERSLVDRQFRPIDQL